MTDAFDLIVVGGGPGGYHAAYLAGKAGMRVALIEKDRLGGTCLNAGCIPTKALLRTAKAFKQVKSASEFGVVVGGVPTVNFESAQARKNMVMDGLREGVRAMMARQQVTVVAGEATFGSDARSVRVGEDTYQAQNILIATGSHPIIPDIPGVNQQHVLTTKQALALDSLPRQFVIYGGHPISLGFASIFAGLGSNVTVITPDDEIMPGIDPELAALLRESATGIRYVLGESMTNIGAQSVTLSEGGTMPADAVLVNVGRAPNITGLDALGLDLHDDRVNVNEQMKTNLPNVYAVGDVTGRSMWAHTALRGAEVAVNTLLGNPDRMRYDSIPVPVYTMPEVAAVGLTEQDAQQHGRNVRVVRLPLNANGRYRVDYPDGAAGLCKMVIDADTNALLGVHLLGEGAVDMIFGVAAMIEDEFRVQDVLGMAFAHPTVSEVLKDALHTLKVT